MGERTGILTRAILAVAVILSLVIVGVALHGGSVQESVPSDSPATQESASDSAQGADSGTASTSTPTSTAPVGDNPRDAQTSPEVPTATQVHEEADDRGFGDAEVQASFDLEGTYHGLTTLGETSEEAWPSYSFSYTSAQGVNWMVYVNDGNYVAVPFSRGTDVLSHQLIFAERDYVTQYDGHKNEFSDFALDELTDGVTGVRVSSLDAATLDTYTFEQLEAM